MNPNDIKIPDYNLAADKEAKEKMMCSMINDLAFEKSPLLEISMSLINEICDQLIRKGWRKVSHA